MVVFENDKIIIKELEEGSSIEGNLLVLESTRKTAKNGPYAMLTLFDGASTIVAKRWSYEGELPTAGTIIRIQSDVGSFRGVKDLNIKRWFQGTIGEEFFKREGIDTEELYEGLEDTIRKLPDERYRSFGLFILEAYHAEMMKAPAAVKMHHNYEGGYLQHSLEVVGNATGIATVMKAAGIQINMSLLILGAAIHDIGKVVGYKMSGLAPEMTDEGKFSEHIALGIKMLSGCQLMYEQLNGCVIDDIVQLLEHIILSHHGELEWGSPVKPCIPEALIVHIADNASAKLTMMQNVRNETTGTWSEKHFALGARIYNGEY